MTHPTYYYYFTWQPRPPRTRWWHALTTDRILFVVTLALLGVIWGAVFSCTHNFLLAPEAHSGRATVR